MNKLTGTLFRELSLKKDKNQQDYYLGKIILSDGSIKVFFFFNPDYDLSLRLTELEANQKLTLQGDWSNKGVKVFLAKDFDLENEFSWLEGGLNEWRVG